MTACVIDGCDKPRLAGGYRRCGMHVSRIRRHGDPTINLHEPVPANNNRDRDDRGRHVAMLGSRNGYAKLTEPQVLRIRHQLAMGRRQRDIAAAFGVTQGAISCIARGKTWGHLKAAR